MPYNRTVRLLSLGYDPVYGPNATRSEFSYDTSIFDYDAVIWDPCNGLVPYADTSAFPYPSTYRGLPALNDNASVRIAADTARRRQEFSEFVKMGRTLITIVRPPQRCFIDTGQKQHSGTGRNRKTTVIVDQFDLLSALPVNDCEFSRSNGKVIELLGGGPLTELLRKYRDSFEYAAIMANPPGEAIARVGGTDRIVSSIHRSSGGGYLVLLPAIDWRVPYDSDSEDFPDEDAQWLPESEQFQIDLLAAIDQLAGSSSITWPTWADQYLTEDQHNLRKDVVKQQERIELARDKLAKLQQRKEVGESRNQLFLGTGRGLELEVKKVLELLGGVVTEPTPGRDDWKVSFPEGKAVVEVKGVTKSAAEKHAAQLEKWVAGELEETGQSPKGFLIVNTWRDTALAERTAPSFPSQMIPYCQSRNHCLITGLQLFIICAEIEKDLARAEHWRKALLATCGEVTGCEDWTSVIRVTAPSDTGHGQD